MMDETIYEPLKDYESNLKEKVNQCAIDTFDKLVKDSKIDVALNEETVKKYNKALNDNQKALKKLNTYKGFRVFLYILILSLFAVCIYSIYAGVQTEFNTLLLVLSIVCPLIAIGLLIYVLKRINPIIKHHTGICNALNDKINKILNECRAQVAPLNDLFEYNMASAIIEKAVPIINLDTYFNNERLQLLMKHYGYKVVNNKNTSTVLVQSGTLNDNPFLILKNRVQHWVDKAYTGSKIISWTETVTDNDGHSHTVTRHQTLTATIFKPMPSYNDETYLVYGNESASNLNFSRNPTNLKTPSEKEIDKYVNRRDDHVEDLADKAVQKGKNFTPLANMDFEVLFGALNRNNEVEFRLLFTPLAQNNEIDLITKNKYYGDDFTFTKNGPINYIHTNHLQGFDLSQNPMRFYSHDVNIMKTNFVNYINDYFRQIYFQLAPLLAIPLYQQHKPTGFIYDDSFNFNYPLYEEEVMANAFDKSLFKPADSVTENILKVHGVKKVGNSDVVNLLSYGFNVTRLVEFVPKLGMDGRMHNVPVYYDEYHETVASNDIVVKQFKETRHECQSSITGVSDYLGKKDVHNLVYKAGLLAFMAGNSFTDQDDIELNKILGYNNK